MRKDIQLSGWLLVLFIPTLLCGTVLVHFAPPPGPNLSSDQIAAMYRGNHIGALIYGISLAVVGVIWIPAVCALTVLMGRMRPRSLFLMLTHFIAATIAIAAPFLSSIFIMVAALRSSDSSQIVAALSDAGFAMGNITPLPSLFQGVAIAIAIFRDRSSPRVLPKWLGWYNLYYGIALQVCTLTLFFKQGPFAPDGIVGIALPLGSVALWTVLTAIALFRVRPEVWAEADQGVLLQNSESWPA